jgi:hypothetical protein
VGHDWTGLDWTGLDLLVGIGTVYITAGCFSFATSAAPTLGKKVKLKIEEKKKAKESSNDLSLCQPAIEWKKPRRNRFIP